MPRRRLPARLLASPIALQLAIALLAPGVAAAAPVSPEQARALFERFKSLAGEWREKSSAGWTGTSAYRVIAKGSVVMSSLTFDDPDPNDTHGMVTMISLDGDRLLLTHYCEAGNQPRLVATDLSDDGRSVTFTFLDGGNLKSRNQGHMDTAVYRFIDEDHVSGRWTWYANGKETWFEEIVNERVKD